MKLQPQDLGAKRRLAVLFRRSGRTAPARPKEQDGPALGFWGRRWASHANLDDVTADALMPRRFGALATCYLAGLAMVPPTILGGIGILDGAAYDGALPMFLLSASTIVLCWRVLPRRLARRAQKIANTPMTAAEIAALMPDADDSLERAFLTLAMDVTRQEVVAPTAEADLRSALRALGDAIDRLPATRVVEDGPDILTEVLRRVAAESLTQAQNEPDRVVAASLVRRAEAMQRRADATQRASALTRRFGALRQEMAAETEALRAGLAAFYTGAHDISDLTRLAEDVRRVAQEAAAITSAREELDDALAAPIPVADPNAAVLRQRLG